MSQKRSQTNQQWTKKQWINGQPYAISHQSTKVTKELNTKLRKRRQTIIKYSNKNSQRYPFQVHVEINQIANTQQQTIQQNIQSFMRQNKNLVILNPRSIATTKRNINIRILSLNVKGFNTIYKEKLNYLM